MQVEEIVRKLNDRQKGQIFTVVVERPADVYKTVTDTIVKRSEFQGQLCDYARRAPVREAVEAGDREAPELPSHIKESFEVEGIKFWRNKNEKTIYLCIPNTGNPPKVEWFLNGEPVSKDAIKHMLKASETASKPSKETVESKGQALFFAPKVENVKEVR